LRFLICQEEAITIALGVRKRLSANIKKGRERLGYTQEKFAEITDLSVQTISDIEGCRTWVSDKTLLRLAEALRVDISQLLAPPLGIEKTDFNNRQQVDLLRQLMKEDVDKRLDQFLGIEQS
jgi:transcriptional regulator with XRE-family HTH domain